MPFINYIIYCTIIMDPYQPTRNKHFSWPWYISLSPNSTAYPEYIVKYVVIFMKWVIVHLDTECHTMLHCTYCSALPLPLDILARTPLGSFPLRLSCLYPGSTDARWNQYLWIPSKKMYADISPWHLNDTAATVVLLKFPIWTALINTHWTFWLLNSWFSNVATFFI